MTKADAVNMIRDIQRGSGVRRDDVLDVVDRGEVAVREWHNGVFSLGFEYGVILGLARAFGITRADVEA